MFFLQGAAQEKTMLPSVVNGEALCFDALLYDQGAKMARCIERDLPLRSSSGGAAGPGGAVLAFGSFLLAMC
jgi:hypothetical protein